MAQDVKMYYIDDDIKKIQTKPNLYVYKYGNAGVFHLFREIAQNDVDEVIDPESNGSSIHYEYDIATRKIRCEDDGRGFPEQDYPLDIFCTKNQAGSKFFRDQGGESSGEFGVGLTVVNALSETFTLTSYREVENTKHKISFREGEKVNDITENLTKRDKSHGSMVEFIVSEKYMGEDSELPWEEAVEWVDKLTYFIRKKKIKITFDIFDGMELIASYKFKPKPFEELLDKLVSDTKYSPKCCFSNDGSIKEKVRKTTINSKTNAVEIKETTMKKTLHLDVALRYVSGGATLFDSYCNWTNTIDGGVHENVVERCFCNYLQAKTKATMTDNQKEKTPILWDDIRTGLCCVINLSTNAQVGFVGNAKTKIGEESLVPVLTEMVNSALDEFFSNNTACLNAYISIIKLNAKARIEMQKVRAATQKERMNNFKEHEMRNYIACTNRGKNDFRELFLVEGDSPAGAARNGSDPRTQAFFMFRGVTANAWKGSLTQVMENAEYQKMITVMRCGIGRSFDISKLWFKRINLFTDQDIDGFNISSGILGFFYRFLSPIIEAGLLFKVFTPLYNINDADTPFAMNKAEMVEIAQKKIVKNYKIIINGDKLDKDDVYKFLEDTYYYRENLNNLANSNGKVNKYLVEAIMAFMVMGGVVQSATEHEDLEKLFKNQKFITYLMSNIQKRFPEVNYIGDNKIKGVINNKLSTVKVNDRFIRKAADLIPVYKSYGYISSIREKNGDQRDMTIGEFLDDTTKYTAKIIERYKGLGELNGEDLWKYALDINNRISVQYTMKGIEAELATFKKVHGQTAADLKLRKEMMALYKIRRDDLDN